MPVMDFLAVRFTVATVVMFALRPTCLRGMTLQGLRRGVGLGAVLGAGYITQTYGLRFASATVSGFITGMFVVLTPVISWLILGKKLNRNTIIGSGVSHGGAGAAQPARLECGYGGITDAGLRDIFCGAYRRAGRMVGHNTMHTDLLCCKLRQ